MTEASSSHRIEKICALCNENESKYCCPRCGALYCSLNCYKSEKHLQCSENFYKDCITEELAGHQADDASKRKMIDILTKMHKQDAENPANIEDILASLDEYNEIDTDHEDSVVDSDDYEYVELKDRVEGLNLDDADEIWNALTEDERNEFEALVKKGDVDAILPRWEPWWHFIRKDKLVEDLADDVEIRAEEAALTKCPVLKKVSKLTNLTSIKPSPSIKFNIINVVASYAFVIRYFNGEIEPAEGIPYLLRICSNLDSNTNFEDPQIAVESVAQNCIQSELIVTDKESLDAMKHDTMLLLNGPSSNNKAYYCKACLSHIHQLLSDAKKGLKSQSPTEKVDKSRNGFTKMFPENGMAHLPSLDVSKVKKCIKKIEYYLSYMECYGMTTE